jgi:poly(hydroxyalkanoate) depolymerase family esterase
MIGIDQDDMVQALNLTRAGRLAEATEFIQQTLRSPSDRLDPRRGVAGTLQRSLGSPQGLQLPVRYPVLPPGQALRSGSLGAGELLDKTYGNDSGARQYTIYIPPDCSNHGLAVIVMLHGGTQAVLDYAAGTGMNRLADLHHFLVVYPEQDVRANPMRYWNWFRPQDQQPGIGEPALIAGITEQVIRDYDADPDRVFIVGFSSGAAMATVMAATYPHLYAAAGVHSGLPYGTAYDVPSAFALMRGESLQSRRGSGPRIPLIVFHGDHDEIVNVVNASHIREQRLGIDGPRTAVGDISVTHGQVPGGHAFTQTTYSDEVQVLLEQWIVHRAGHAWSGGTSGCSYTDPQGPDASAEMVRFFEEHARRKP